MRDGLERLIQKRRLTQKTEEETGPNSDTSLSHESANPLLAGVRERLLAEPEAGNLAPDAARSRIQSLVEEIYHNEFQVLALSREQRLGLVNRLMNQIYGLGLLEPLVADPAVTEIMVNGPQTIFIERKGTAEVAVDAAGQSLRFTSEEELSNVIERIVARVNRKVDESTPIVDARLPNGARVNVVVPPISLVGPVLTIRKFPQQPFSLADLCQRGALTPPSADLLDRLVHSRCNIVVSGGTSTGKTTFLNALAARIPKHERIITIEDAAELQITGVPNLVRMEARPANLEGKGAITIRDLVRTSLRMRPDRIIVGECRGPETLDMLQAMNTGHDGSLTTVHANTARDALQRIETMTLMAGLELPLSTVRRQIASAIHFVIHLARLSNGRRVVMQIIEVMEASDGVSWQDLYKYDPVQGELVHCGQRICRREPFELSGCPLPTDV